MAITHQQIEKAVRLAKAYGAKRLILFGRAEEEPEKARDLDLACDGVEGWKLYELGAKLEEELRTNVDLVPLSPSTRFTRRVEAKGRVLL